MFNPANLEALKHMTPEDMRRAGEMMSKLSPEELKRMAAMSGMGGVDPNMMSQAASAMSQMSPETFNAMKGAMPAMGGAPQQPAAVPGKLEPVVRMKNKGNEYFGKGQLLDAIEQYEGAIKALEGQGLGQDVINLEVTCRTNLATVEAKRQNWPAVVTQCKQVLTFDPNSYKACFRYGQALMETGEVVRAEEMLDKAGRINPGDKAVGEMLAELRSHKVDPAPKEEAKAESPKVAEVQPDAEEAKREEAKEEPKAESQLKNHPKNRGIKIEDVIDPPPAPKATPAQPPVPAPAVPMPMSGGRIDPGMVAQQRETLKNMDDSQLSAMLETMKHMDPATMAAMSKQFGMEITPEQIQMMTQHLTPEMMRTAAGAAGPMPRISSEEGKEGGAAAMPQMNSAFLQDSLNNPAMTQMLSGLLSKQFGRSEDEAALVLGCLRRLINIFVAVSKVYNIFFSGRRKYMTGASFVCFLGYYYS